MSDEHFAQRSNAIREEIESRQAQKQDLQEEERGLQEQLSEQQKKETESKVKLAALQSQIGKLGDDIETWKNDMIELLNNRASTQAKGQRYDTMLEQVQVRRSEVAQKLLKVKSDEENWDNQIAEQNERLTAIDAEIEKLLSQAESLEEEVKAANEEIRRLNRNLSHTEQDYHTAHTKLESLRNLAERYDGYGNSIKRVMEVRDRIKGIHGVVADLLQAEKKYETAIETALGGSIQNIVTDNEATAKYLIEYLKRGHFGRATFLPLTSMRGKKTQVNEDAARETGVLGVANALVSYDPVYEGLVAQLLGRTLVVDTIDHAIVIQRKYRQTLRMVTLEGELLSPGGSMTGGSFRNNSNLLGRRREIEELEKSVQGLAKELREIQQELEEKKNKRNEIRDLRTELNEKLQRQYIEQNTVRLNLEKAREKKTEIRLDFEALQKESLEIRKSDRRD